MTTCNTYDRTSERERERERETERERQTDRGGGRCLYNKCSVSKLKFPLLVSELNLMNSSIFDELFNKIKWFFASS